jgi:hypothetical protein
MPQIVSAQITRFRDLEEGPLLTERFLERTATLSKQQILNITTIRRVSEQLACLQFTQGKFPSLKAVN